MQLQTRNPERGKPAAHEQLGGVKRDSRIWRKERRTSAGKGNGNKKLESNTNNSIQDITYAICRSYARVNFS